MTNKILIIIFLLFNSLIVFGQEIPIPENYVIIDTISGDLDNDNIKELVAVFDTKKPDEEYESVPRELRIYKFENGSWVEWKKSEQALHGSRDGGMMGDPYVGIEIKNGILLISHYGGSSWKWGHTDKYRFQNDDFFLIGYESNSGRLCDYWLNVDFNLSTGKIIVKKEFEDCETSEQEIYKRENETFYEEKLKITLEKRYDKEIRIVSPKYKHEIYI
ncbi:MAG: hypothetical protein WCY89_05225 [Flavobacteriaceae bacterium]